MQFDENAFKLPRPPSSHMWKHNPEGLQITEVFLNGKLATRLHPYQLDGIQFLYECVLGFRRIEGSRSLHDEISTVAADGDNNGDDVKDIYGGILA